MTKEMPEDLRDALRSELHRQLADATNLVWHMQHTASGGGDIAELEKQAYALRERAIMILGHVVRWSLLKEARP